MIEKNFFLSSPRHFIKFFQGYVTSYPIAQGMCRPLLMLTFALNFFLGKLEPAGYHIFNLFFHTLNGILLYILIKTLARGTPRTLCALISMIFIAHPLSTEAVSYISSRSDLLAVFFILSGILFFLNRNRIGLYTCYTLALLTKETALILLPLLAAFVFFTPYTPSIHGDKNRLRTAAISLILITMFYLLYRHIYFGGTPAGRMRPFLSNILLESQVTFFYFKKFFWPTGLNFLHACADILPPYRITDFAAFAALIALFAGALALRKKQPLAGLGIVFVLIALSPKFYASLKVPVAEHHFYTASIGMYIAALPLLMLLYRKIGRYLFYWLASIAIAGAILTVERNHELTNPKITWQKGVKEEPQHIGNWINLGMAYKEEGDYETAQNIFNKALLIRNSDHDWQAGLYYQIAGVYFAKGQFDKTIIFLDKALGANPKPARIFQIYERLGATYREMGNPKTALQYWQKALSFNPYDVSIYQSMAATLIEEREPDLALTLIESTFALNREDFYSYFLLGKIREAKGDLPKAKKCYLEAIALNPSWFYPHYALAIIYHTEHNPAAKTEAQETLKLEPNFVPAQELKKLLQSH
jgi:tetratricopeptide (TPR) repeat protein